MRRYQGLSAQTVELDEYSMVPIRDEDRYAILKWRNEQMYHLRQAKLLTHKAQDAYFENVVAKLFEVEKPDQMLFSFLEHGQLIGYGGIVHINWLDQHAELSFIMNTELESTRFEELWSSYLECIEKLAFDDLRLHKLFVYAFDLRPHLYEVLESCGYFLDARLTDHCRVNGEFLDVVIHSKTRQR